MAKDKLATPSRGHVGGYSDQRAGRLKIRWPGGLVAPLKTFLELG